MFFSLIQWLARCTLFPYSTLFRSRERDLLEVGEGGTGSCRQDQQPVAPGPRDRLLVLPAASCTPDRKTRRLNSSHSQILYAVFCFKKKKGHFTNRTLAILSSESQL